MSKQKKKAMSKELWKTQVNGKTSRECLNILNNKPWKTEYF